MPPNVGTPTRRRALASEIAFFDLEALDFVRRRAQQAASLGPDREAGWSALTTEPLRLLGAFPSLRLKPTYMLRAHVCFSAGDGYGRVYALPQDAPPSELPGPLELEDPPAPAAALEHFMDAIEGDGSAWSYIQSSLFYREAKEFGAFWHGVDWGSHHLVDSNPLAEAFQPNAGDESTRAAARTRSRSSQDIYRHPSGSLSEWLWLEELEQRPTQSRDWRPQVSLDAGQVVVSFYSFSALWRQAIYHHHDIYHPGSYRPESIDGEIAFGPVGIIY